MKQLDLSILQKNPQLSISAILEIEPLAPLSMVSELPGSYYNTLKVPDKKMLCGLFENILGWHIDCADRKAIIRELKIIRKTQKKDYSDHVKGSTYIPLLIEYFDIDDVEINLSEGCFYDDLWSRAYRRADADVHPKGTANLDYKLISQKRELKRDDNNSQLIDNKVLGQFFKENIEGYPLYYSTPTMREYVDMKGLYSIKLSIDCDLFELFEGELHLNNIGYLGNSEGWVNLKIKKYDCHTSVYKICPSIIDGRK